MITSNHHKDNTGIYLFCLLVAALVVYMFVK